MWWTKPTLTVRLYSGLPRRIDSSAPHSARVRIAGRVVSAKADDRGRVNASAPEVPGSTSSIRTSRGAAPPSDSTLTCTPSDGPTHRGDVPSRWPGPGVSGRCSPCSSSGSHSVQRPSRRVRAVTASRTSGSGSQVTPSRLKPAVCFGALASSSRRPVALAVRSEPWAAPRSIPRSRSRATDGGTGRGRAQAGVTVSRLIRATVGAASRRPRKARRRTGTAPGPGNGSNRQTGRGSARRPVHCHP